MYREIEVEDKTFDEVADFFSNGCKVVGGTVRIDKEDGIMTCITKRGGLTIREERDIETQEISGRFQAMFWSGSNLNRMFGGMMNINTIRYSEDKFQNLLEIWDVYGNNIMFTKVFLHKFKKK